MDEFIDAAIEALSNRPESGFDAERARRAGERIRQLRKGLKLDRGSASFRDLAHLEHKY